MKSQLGGEKNGFLTVSVAAESGERGTTHSPVANNLGRRVQVYTQTHRHTCTPALLDYLEYRFSSESQSYKINKQFKTVWQILIYLGLRVFSDFFFSITGKWLPSSWSRIGAQQPFYFPKCYKRKTVEGISDCYLICCLPFQSNGSHKAAWNKIPFPVSTAAKTSD